MNGVDSLGLGQMASIESYSACMAILCYYNGGGGD